MTRDGGTSWVTYGVTHGSRRPDTLELQKSLLITGRKQWNCPGGHFVQPQVGAPPERLSSRPTLAKARGEPGPITTGGDHGSPLSRGRPQMILGFVSPKCAAPPPPHAEEHRSATRAQALPQPTRAAMRLEA